MKKSIVNDYKESAIGDALVMLVLTALLFVIDVWVILLVIDAWLALSLGMRIKRLGFTVRAVYVCSLALIFFKLIGFGYGVSLIYSNPPPAGVHVLYKRLGFLAWAGMPDMGLFEGLIRHRESEFREELVVYAKSDELRQAIDGSGSDQGEFPDISDQYSHDGRGVMWIRDGQSIYLYSVGPDSRDDGAAIIYDPTNGICSSRGDVVISLSRWD